MANNAQKTPLTDSLNAVAIARAQNQIQRTGKSLPCTVVSVAGSIVRVKFAANGPYTLPQVTVPLIGSEYVRAPIQPGCKGWVIAADAYLGGMSGLGGGVADLTQRGNLTALVFAPMGNKGWSSVDGNVLTLYGPEGVTIRSQDSNAQMLMTPTSITLSVGGMALVITASGITIAGKDFLAHEHDGTQPGSGNTGGVV